MTARATAGLLTIIAGVSLIGAQTAVFAGELVLHFKGVGQGKGPIRIEVLHESRSDQFLNPNKIKGATLVMLPADQPPYSVKVEVPKGRYAVSAYQDIHRLGRIDLSGPYGSPAVPWGVSNNARPSTRAPDFAEAAIVVGDGVVVQTIDLGL